MRWAFAALAAAAVMSWTGAIRPAPDRWAAASAQFGDRANGGFANLSLFEEFPFSVHDGSAAAGFDPAGAEPVALDPDPDRFGPPFGLLPKDFDPSLSFVPAGEDRGSLAEAAGAVWNTVLSDPLLRDVFGPGPLARLFDEMGRTARGEGGPRDIASAPPAWQSPRLRWNDWAWGRGAWVMPEGLAWGRDAWVLPDGSVSVPGAPGRTVPQTPVVGGAAEGSGGRDGDGGGGSVVDDGVSTVVSVPEPSSFAALMFGLVGLIAASRRSPHGPAGSAWPAARPPLRPGALLFSVRGGQARACEA